MNLFFLLILSHSIPGLITMTNRKDRFNLFKNDKFKFKLENLGEKGEKDKSDSQTKKEKEDSSHFPSFDSIIPESSPLKNNSNSHSNSGFYNDEFKSKNQSNADGDLDGVDEKYAKYIYSKPEGLNDSDEEDGGFSDDLNGLNKGINEGQDKKTIKNELLRFKANLLNQKDSSKSSFAKITVLLIILVLVSSIFYFFVYQPFQNELDLEKNSKLNELNALYKGPLEVNDNAYTLENRINQAYDIEEIKSIDVLRYATKDWRIYHSSKIVSCKDDFGRVMMSYGEDKNIIMSVKDANDFVKDNDAKVLSNVQFEKVNTVIVPISLSRLQATAGLISVGSVVDVYSLSDNDSDYSYPNEDINEDINEDEDLSEDEEISNNLSSISSNETLNGNLEETEKDPIVSGATVLAILRSKDSGLVESTVSKSKTVIKGNETKPFENTVSYSSDVEELLKSSVLNSKSDSNVLDSYLMNYGVRLSNFERMSNLGDLDSEYIILLEVPQSDVNFVINNMDNLILTIPTDFAPNWVVDELNETYYENLYQGQSLDFL